MLDWRNLYKKDPCWKNQKALEQVSIFFFFCFFDDIRSYTRIILLRCIKCVKVNGKVFKRDICFKRKKYKILKCFYSGLESHKHKNPIKFNGWTKHDFWAEGRKLHSLSDYGQATNSQQTQIFWSIRLKLEVNSIYLSHFFTRPVKMSLKRMK